jgi:hypothetical protein
MEKTMSKTNDHGMFEDRPLADTDLDMVTGGDNISPALGGGSTPYPASGSGGDLSGLLQFFSAVLNSINAAGSDAVRRA